MSNVNQMIQHFSSISLEEMSGVKLMNRVDTKFIFNQYKLTDLLKSLDAFYRILEIEGKRIQDYKSLYYDTDGRKFFMDHHNNRVNRNKVRFRKYIQSNLSFLEVKRKNNKGNTIKKRTKVKNIPTVLSDVNKEYVEKIIGKSLDIKAKQWINFSRITFIHKKNKERITMDINLSFENAKKNGNLKNIVIVEVKQERMNRSSDFMRIAKEMRIFPTRLSKYCISTIYLEPNIKQNRFKRKLLFLNKIENQS